MSKIGDDDSNDKHSECQENSSKETSERKKYEKKIREQRFNVWVTTDLKGDTQISEMEETTIELIEGSQPCAKENVWMYFSGWATCYRNHHLSLPNPELSGLPSVTPHRLPSGGCITLKGPRASTGPSASSSAARRERVWRAVLLLTVWAGDASHFCLISLALFRGKAGRKGGSQEEKEVSLVSPWHCSWHMDMQTHIQTRTQV